MPNDELRPTFDHATSVFATRPGLAWLGTAVFHPGIDSQDMSLASLRSGVSNRLALVLDILPGPPAIARLGLGAMLVAAGFTKLVDPAGWTVYVADWLAPWLVVSPRVFMLVNGVLELLFGAALLADRFTRVAALIATVSLAATTLYLGVVWIDTGLYGDVVARDIGLTALATAVLVEAFED